MGLDEDYDSRMDAEEEAETTEGDDETDVGEKTLR